MKAQYDITIDLTKGITIDLTKGITIDLTKGQEEFWRQIDEIDNILKPKKGLWSRIKAWFKIDNILKPKKGLWSRIKAWFKR